MKRDEIEIGVEYAEHGPMAYGVVPSKTPARVRFLNKDPNMRMIKIFTKIQDISGKTGWKFVEAQWSKTYADYPNSLHVEEGKQTNIGGLFAVHYPSESPVGALPGETSWDGGVTWHPHPVQPAAVHMTWAEYLDQDRVRREAAAARALNSAPDAMARSWSTIAANARLLGMDRTSLLIWLQGRLDSTTF